MNSFKEELKKINEQFLIQDEKKALIYNEEQKLSSLRDELIYNYLIDTKLLGNTTWESSYGDQAVYLNLDSFNPSIFDDIKPRSIDLQINFTKDSSLYIYQQNSSAYINTLISKDIKANFDFIYKLGIKLDNKKLLVQAEEARLHAASLEFLLDLHKT